MKEKKHKKWDPSLWQGRSQHQVENNYKVIGYTFILFVITLIIGVVLS